ncbi:MAG: hypothetical protein RL238_41 [Actinomycetota bacterium]
MSSRRSLPTVLAVSMVLVALSAVAAWIAVGGLANATDRALARMESALVSARDLADSTASSASELQQVVAVVGDGLGKTADAVAATREVSKSVRELLGIVDFIGSVDSLVTSLEQAEKDLVFVQGSLITASTTLDQAAPALQETVDALAAVPGEIDAAIADSQEAREKIDNQVWLWRLAIVAGALAIIGGLWGVRANTRRVDALLAAVGQPASPAA